MKNRDLKRLYYWTTEQTKDCNFLLIHVLLYMLPDLLILKYKISLAMF